MSKKKKKKYKVKTLKPKSFSSYAECVRWLKKSVYFIARGRKVKEDEINWLSIGTGFLAGNGRMVTAAHVINNPQSEMKMGKHEDGDIYYFIKNDNHNNIHWSIIPTFIINKTLFVEPEIDFAVFYLDDSFYEDEKQVFVNREKDIIPVSLKIYDIGTDIGILGYPLVKLDFEGKDLAKPLLGDILLRTDKGVINCHYNIKEKQPLYEFTLNFNPGNSGGPIFNTVNGYAISIVHGFRDIPIGQEEIKVDETKRFGNYKNDYFINSISTRYSTGISTSCMKEVLEKHGIEIKE